MNLGYAWDIEGEAYHYVVGLPKRRRQRLERAFDAIAAAPFQIPLFELWDEDGMPVHVIEREDHYISFYSDHATRRVRITEVQPLP